MGAGKGKAKRTQSLAQTLGAFKKSAYPPVTLTTPIADLIGLNLGGNDGGAKYLLYLLSNRQDESFTARLSRKGKAIDDVIFSQCEEATGPDGLHWKLKWEVNGRPQSAYFSPESIDKYGVKIEQIERASSRE